MDENEGWGSCLGLVIFLVIVALMLGWNISVDMRLGVNGYGPVRQYDAVVVTKHIDAQKDSSSYMVTTDKQTFEVDNGTLLDVWNADVIYGNLVVGQRYCITAKGNQVTDFWRQQYPFILKAVKGGC